MQQDEPVCLQLRRILTALERVCGYCLSMMRWSFSVAVKNSYDACASVLLTTLHGAVRWPRFVAACEISRRLRKMQQRTPEPSEYSGKEFLLRLSEMEETYWHNHQSPATRKGNFTACMDHLQGSADDMFLPGFPPESMRRRLRSVPSPKWGVKPSNDSNGCLDMSSSPPKKYTEDDTVSLKGYDAGDIGWGERDGGDIGWGEWDGGELCDTEEETGVMLYEQFTSLGERDSMKVPSVGWQNDFICGVAGLGEGREVDGVVKNEGDCKEHRLSSSDDAVSDILPHFGLVKPDRKLLLSTDDHISYAREGAGGVRKAGGYSEKQAVGYHDDALCDDAQDFSSMPSSRDFLLSTDDRFSPWQEANSRILHFNDGPNSGREARNQERDSEDCVCQKRGDSQDVQIVERAKFGGNAKDAEHESGNVPGCEGAMRKRDIMIEGDLKKLRSSGSDRFGRHNVFPGQALSCVCGDDPHHDRHHSGDLDDCHHDRHHLWDLDDCHHDRRHPGADDECRALKGSFEHDKCRDLELTSREKISGRKMVVGFLIVTKGGMQIAARCCRRG